MATLKVILHDAIDLPVMDRSTGHVDPFVSLRLDSTEFISSTCPGTRFPVWNNVFRFDTPDLLVLQEDPLEVRIHHRDILSRNPLVGFVNIDCNSFMYRYNPTMSGWFPLYDDATGLRGELRLTLRIKFHAPGNPLAPRLVERIVSRLPVRQSDETGQGTLKSNGHVDACAHQASSQISTSIAEIVQVSSSSSVKSVLPENAEMAPYSLCPHSSGIQDSSSDVLKKQGNALNGLPTSKTEDAEQQSINRIPRSDEKVLCNPDLQAYGINQEYELEPISVQHLHPSTFASEEEGVHIFSVSRLDPFVYRIEETKSMVEELLVKADPEHFPLTTLRSSHNVNRARLVQLFKLSGKVRRQLAHKVIGLQCNAVLGYAEQFDMEPYGIIVRAYGTPCVVSTVKCIDLSTALRTLGAPSGLDSTVPNHHSHSSKAKVKNTIVKTAANNSNFFAKNGSCTETLSTENIHEKSMVLSTAPEEKNCKETLSSLPDLSEMEGREISNGGGEEKFCRHSHSKGEGEKSYMDEKAWKKAAGQARVEETSSPFSPSIKQLEEANADEIAKEEMPKTLVSGSRATVITLSVKELPSGCIQHFGGYICARSVKIISKSKSKPLILQERDVWWMELREELRANARAFHCNAILGYEEISQYQDDVALLALSGTAVMIPPSMVSLRAGPDYLFRAACTRKDTKKDCSILHIYSSTSRKRLSPSNLRWSPHSLCGICRKQLVPNFLLGSCHIPSDVELTGSPRLVEVHVAQYKKDVKNIELAKVASQELPFIEFALHKQLIFQLRMQGFNACFGMSVSIVLGPDAIVGTLTGTGCHIAGLPTPSSARMEIVDPLIKNLEPVKLLRDILQRSRRRRHQSSSSSSSSSPSSTSSSEGRKARRRNSIKSSSSSSSSSSSWVSSNDSQNDIFPAPEQLRTGGGSKMADVVVKIDDREEADLMLGMLPRSDFTSSKTSLFQDDVLLTVPYVPSTSNAYYLQHQVVIIRRYNLSKMSTSPSLELFSEQNSGRGSTNRVFNNCCADAKEAFFQAVCRIAMCTPEVKRIQVVNYRMHIQFEQRSHDMHMRVEGVVVGENDRSYAKLRWLEEEAFRHCTKMICASRYPPLTPTSEEAISIHQQYCCLPTLQERKSEANDEGTVESTSSNTLLNGPMSSDDVGRRHPPATFSPSFDLKNDDSTSRQSICPIAPSLSGQLFVPPHYKELLHLFIRSTAPFSLPYVFCSDVGMLKPWSTQMYADGSPHGTDEIPDRFTTYDIYRVPQNESKSFVSRMRSWISSFNDSFSRFNTSSTRNDGAKSSLPPQSRASADIQEENAASTMDNRCCPVFHSLDDECDPFRQHFPTVLMSGLDYVPGFRVVRYLGRLSQHFIREDTGVITAKQLGAFYQALEHEVLSMVQSLVILQGGNALLQYSIVFHEIEDSEGSGNVSALMTVAGDVVQVTEALEI